MMLTPPKNSNTVHTADYEFATATN